MISMSGDSRSTKDCSAIAGVLPPHMFYQIIINNSRTCFKVKSVLFLAPHNIDFFYKHVYFYIKLLLNNNLTNNHTMIRPYIYIYIYIIQV